MDPGRTLARMCRSANQAEGIWASSGYTEPRTVVYPCRSTDDSFHARAHDRLSSVDAEVTSALWNGLVPLSS